ncbi:hypothetical protein SAMN05660226_03626 [Parapedobacter luteus]|uniref:DUF5683 domain-containing protein n=1 Tax=Parapedobacter luteus TaxID=623280 RepID=A0A1T5EXN9_9SPHI|nr:DUF5683 domain-containing protein [Parapedobacter luteus]SKB88707.1 hypothetical protein SAMN05660226_03626 [Parapedobacter luteus]
MNTFAKIAIAALNEPIMKFLFVFALIFAIPPISCTVKGSEYFFVRTFDSGFFPIEDTAKDELLKDSTRLAMEARTAKVWKRSLIVPGWGQYTNGGLWWVKVPVIYGGFVAGVLIYNFNQNYYKTYLAEAQYRILHNDAPPPWSLYQFGDEIQTTRFTNAKDAHRRNRDLTVLLAVGWWGLNAVEAYVSDILKNRWSISENLAARVSPAMLSTPLYGVYSPVIGLKVQVDFE